MKQKVPLPGLKSAQKWISVLKFGKLVPDKNQHPRDTIIANFHVNRTTLTFLAQICPKLGLRLQIQKTNVGIRITILQIPCVPIFRRNGKLKIFRSKFAQILDFGV